MVYRNLSLRWVVEVSVAHAGSRQPRSRTKFDCTASVRPSQHRSFHLTQSLLDLPPAPFDASTLK